MIVPSTLGRVYGVPSIPDILTALELCRNVSVDDLARMHHILAQDWRKVARQVWVNRRWITGLAVEHGGGTRPDEQEQGQRAWPTCLNIEQVASIDRHVSLLE